tara:strand:+ start:1809 stop:2357 length:549 start_codon:yes stop_codon:yes gene_type:complete
MKYSSVSFDKNEEHDYDNKYELKIKLFAIKNNYNIFDDKVIQYTISLKNEIIDSLEKNSSNSDKIKVKYIKWIEKYLDKIHENLIERKMKIPTKIKKQKNFVYTSNKNLVARPLGKRNILSRRKWIWIRDQYHNLKKKKIANTNEEYSRLIRSELCKNKPYFWEGNVYEIETIKDILDRQNW